MRLLLTVNSCQKKSLVEFCGEQLTAVNGFRFRNEMPPARAARRRPACALIGYVAARRNDPGDDPYLDITRLTDDTGSGPAFDVAAAVADYVAWRADHPR
jgi:hypothetical protein